MESNAGGGQPVI